MSYKVKNLIIGYGASGLIATNLLSSYDISFNLSYPQKNFVKKKKWHQYGYFSEYFSGKYGNLNIWGSCLRQIPYSSIQKAYPEITNSEYFNHCEKVLNFFGKSPVSWEDGVYSLYYHYKKNLLNFSRIENNLKADFDEIATINEKDGFYEVYDIKNKKIICDNILFCTPVPETVKLLSKIFDLKNEQLVSNEHFLFLNAHFKLNEKVNPRKFQHKSSEVSIRKHIDNDETSIILIPRLTKNTNKNKSIVHVRRAVISSVISKRYIRAFLFAIRHPIEVFSLLLWNLGIHPSTKYFDSIVMVNRKISISHEGAIKKIINDKNCISDSEINEIRLAAKKINASVFIHGNELHENSQHIYGITHKSLNLDSNGKVYGKNLYLLGANALRSNNISNITFSLMVITSIIMSKIHEKL